LKKAFPGEAQRPRNLIL